MPSWLRPRDNPADAPKPPAPNATDEALVAAARHDPRAFTALYERYVERVYRYCFVRLDHREAAEDATSEIFIKALANIESQRGVFAGWLFRIAHNVVIDVYRRRRPGAPIEEAHDLHDPAPMPDEIALSRAESATLRAAMARLPEEQRVVLELQLADWSGQQIADAIGKTPAAVKQLRYRAISRLRVLLGDSDTRPEEATHDLF